MADCEFDDVVCAGVSAVKWIANREPERDRQQIRALEAVLSTIRAGRFILVSTIDVYPVLSGEDETFDCASLANNAYGTHRLEFEQFCRQRFPDCYIVRLPALFGKGLKKNVIYDLLNHNCLEMINPASSFQYYDLDNLWADIDRMLASDIHLLNLFTEPVVTQTVIDRFFANSELEGLGRAPAPEAHYALKSRYYALWGGVQGYLYSESQVLEQMGRYIDSERGA